MKESFRDSLSAVGVTILNVGTQVIEMDGPDDATGLVYCQGQVADGDRWIHQAILYRDTYARRQGQWLFVRRVHELWYGVEAATHPMQQPPANWPQRADGVGTVPGSFDTWAAFWSPSAT